MPEDFAIETNPRKGFSLIPGSLDLYDDAGEKLKQSKRNSRELWNGGLDLFSWE